jgi:hypothetical protein
MSETNDQEKDGAGALQPSSCVDNGISGVRISPDVCCSKIPILINDSDLVPKMNTDRSR